MRRRVPLAVLAGVLSLSLAAAAFAATPSEDPEPPPQPSPFLRAVVESARVQRDVRDGPYSPASMTATVEAYVAEQLGVVRREQDIFGTGGGAPKGSAVVRRAAEHFILARRAADLAALDAADAAVLAAPGASEREEASVLADRRLGRRRAELVAALAEMVGVVEYALIGRRAASGTLPTGNAPPRDLATLAEELSDVFPISGFRDLPAAQAKALALLPSADRRRLADLAGDERVAARQLVDLHVHTRRLMDDGPKSRRDKGLPVFTTLMKRLDDFEGLDIADPALATGRDVYATSLRLRALVVLAEDLTRRAASVEGEESPHEALISTRNSARNARELLTLLGEREPDAALRAAMRTLAAKLRDAAANLGARRIITTTDVTTRKRITGLSVDAAATLDARADGPASATAVLLQETAAAPGLTAAPTPNAAAPQSTLTQPAPVEAPPAPGKSATAATQAPLGATDVVEGPAPEAAAAAGGFGASVEPRAVVASPDALGIPQAVGVSVKVEPFDATAPPAAGVGDALTQLAGFVPVGGEAQTPPGAPLGVEAAPPPGGVRSQLEAAPAPAALTWAEPGVPSLRGFLGLIP